MYTFSYVAIYGGPFVPSANCTISLFSRKGFTAIINDSLVGAVLYVGSLIGGAIAAFVALGWVKAEAAKTNPDGSGIYFPDLRDGIYGEFLQILFVICGGYAGMYMTVLSMTVFRSAVATTFVVWADDAPALAQHRPAQYKALADGAHKMYGPSGPGYAIVGSDGSYPQSSPPPAMTSAPPGGQPQPAVMMIAVQPNVYEQQAGTTNAGIQYSQPVNVSAQVSAPIATPGVYVNVQASAPPAQL